MSMCFETGADCCTLETQVLPGPERGSVNGTPELIQFGPAGGPLRMDVG
jgi:hypothetical protein